MEHTVPHDVGRELAKKATLAAMAHYAEKYKQYDPRTTWTGDYTANIVVHIKGVSLDGKIEVGETKVVLDLDVPFLFRPFRARALAIIEREIGTWIARVKSGEFS